MRYPGSEGEGTSSSNNGGQTNNKDGGDSSKPKYSIPGILHFIQHEWAR